MKIVDFADKAYNLMSKHYHSFDNNCEVAVEGAGLVIGFEEKEVKTRTRGMDTVIIVKGQVDRDDWLKAVNLLRGIEGWTSPVDLLTYTELMGFYTWARKGARVLLSQIREGV